MDVHSIRKHSEADVPGSGYNENSLLQKSVFALVNRIYLRFTKDDISTSGKNSYKYFAEDPPGVDLPPLCRHSDRRPARSVSPTKTSTSTIVQSRTAG